jgi:hypothetical protein
MKEDATVKSEAHEDAVVLCERIETACDQRKCREEAYEERVRDNAYLRE